MTRRWSFAWSWTVAVLLALTLPSCGGWPFPPPTPPEQKVCASPETRAAAAAGKIAGTMKGARKDEWVVKLQSPAAAQRMLSARAVGVEAIGGPYLKFTGPKSAAEALYSESGVVAVYPNKVKSIPKPIEPTATAAIGSWGIDRVDQRDLPLDDKYVSYTPGDPAVVHAYVNDTGITPAHPDFRGRVGEGYSAVGGSPLDDHGHGTHVAGTIVSETYGMSKVIVHGCRSLINGSGTTADVIECIQWSIQHAADHGWRGVGNMSLGGSVDEALDDAVCESAAADFLWAVAAGNDNADACGGSPARTDDALTVGATSDNDARAYFSSYGKCVDLFAPGENITSLDRSNGTAVMSGTSMATPHVTAAAALYVSTHPEATFDEIHAGVLAMATPSKITDPGADSPNLLLFVGKEGGGGGLPKVGEPVGPERLLRPDGTRLKTNAGQPFDAVMAVPCCRSFYPQDIAIRRPAPFRVVGVDTPTLWPLASEAWQQYTEANGAANAFHFRMGPFYADAETEVEWEKWGGPYLTPGGEWNPAFWQRARELAWSAYLDRSYVEVVVIDSWGCKYSQAGNRYLAWPQEAIDACGRTWHSEHERYARKIVEQFGCFGNVIWALDNEGQGISGWQADWYLKLGSVVRQAEEELGCGFTHMEGSSVPGVREAVDYSITHARQPLTIPIAGRWTLNNERNPSYSPAEEESIFAAARKRGLGWALWRDGMDDGAFEDTLARFKRVVEEGPAPSSCPKELAPGAMVYLNDKAYGHGFDSTVRVSGDPEFCRLIHGEAVNDCHLEGWAQRSACEMELLGGCPIWQFRTAAQPTPQQCLQPAHPVASCDHWGTAGGAQDDPHTPEYEGLPYECSYQRVDGFPAAGFYAVVRGKGDTRACKPDGTGCGPWRIFDKAVP